MDYINKAKPQPQSRFTEKTNLIQNSLPKTEYDIDNKEITVDNYNNRSILKQKFRETQLKNI